MLVFFFFSADPALDGLQSPRTRHVSKWSQEVSTPRSFIRACPVTTYTHANRDTDATTISLLTNQLHHTCFGCVWRAVCRQSPTNALPCAIALGMNTYMQRIYASAHSRSRPVIITHPESRLSCRCAQEPWRMRRSADRGHPRHSSASHATHVPITAASSLRPLMLARKPTTF